MCIALELYRLLHCAKRDYAVLSQVFLTGCKDARMLHTYVGLAGIGCVQAGQEQRTVTPQIEIVIGGHGGMQHIHVAYMCISA